MHGLLLLVAAFLAGALNAAAGGGTFLTLPALMLVGVSPVAANATGTVALLPGYAASTWGFREELRARPGVGLLFMTMLSLLGGALGAGLLLATSNAAFRAIVPWLMLAATVLFELGPWLMARLRRSAPAGRKATAAGVLLASLYGGYFNGGLGIVLLAMLGLLGYSSLNFMNGVKNLVSTVLTTIAVLVYALGGAVVWSDALLMMPAAIAGGYVGARVAQRIPEGRLRFGIVVIGAATTVWFFVRR